jgi:hypothetical protein
MGNQPQHLDFLNQVIPILMDVGEAVDFFAREMGRSGHNIFVLGVLRQLVGLSRGVNVGKKGRVGRYVFHLLASVVNDVLQIFQAFDVICFGSYHLSKSLSSVGCGLEAERSKDSILFNFLLLPPLAYYRPFKTLLDMTSLMISEVPS